MVQTPYVPAGAAWADVHNFSFEDGATGGVGNDWTANYQTRFSSDPTYAVTTDRATNGSYAQKITMPQIPTGSGHVNQKAGVHQQIYVIPGETYTVTVDVYMELSSGEAYSGEKMVGMVGLDPYGDTNLGAGSVVWSNLEGQKNQWTTLQVSTTAVFEVMTVYTSGMLKWESTGEGRIWIDNFAISGPVPTENPSPPEEDWVDPDSSMPATTGSELIANGSFETGWSGGVAGSWSAWTASGTGYQRQSTRIGPAGGGKYDFSSADTIANLNPRVALTSVFGDADYWATLPHMEDTLVIGRTVIDNQEEEISDPINNGRAFADDYYIEQQYHPRIDAWCGLNEPDWNEPNWTNALLWEKAFTERCHELGMKTVVLNLAVGNPGNIWKMLDAEELMSIADYVGYHTYGGQIDQLMINASPAENDPCSFALRWRKYVDMYRDRGWRMAPAMYTEGTTYGGWHSNANISATDIRDDLIAFGPFINEDRWATGLALFCAGCGGVWEEWDIQGQGIENDVGAWNYDNPTEATDGLYSQQFGAGMLHVDNWTDWQTYTGNYTGGIVQQVTGLINGNTYLLDLDFRYEFRGVQPQVQFYTGVDTTGQTSNPNAGSIVWSSDIIAAENVNHDSWERTWRTFTAAGSTASIWIKSAQSVSNPVYRVSVDRVSVKQTDGGASGPAIGLSTTQLSPSATEGGNPANDSFTVRNTGSDTLNYSISDNVSWLSCSPTSGSSTGEQDTITVTYSASSLTEGTYNGTISISDPNAGNDPQTIAVTLTINAPSSGPSLVNGDFSNGLTGWSQWTERGTISFTDNAGRGHVSGNDINGGLWQQFNTGGASTQIDITGWWESNPTAANNQWAEVLIINGSRTPVNGQDINDGQSDVEMIYKNDTWTSTGGWSGDMDQTSPVANVGTFTAADTVATIVLKTGNVGGTTTGTLYDNLVVAEAGGATPTIALNKSSLSPSTNEGSSPSNDTFTVSNSGGGTLNYSVSDNKSWLSVSPTSGTSDGEADTITVSYSAGSLAPGTYNATITVSDSAATNNPQTIGVTLTVNALPATITLNKSTLSPSCDEGTSPTNDSFTVQNTGGSTTLSYSISDDAAWLSCSPTSGTSDGEIDTITVSYSAGSLSPGTYNATITVSDPNATNNPQTIAVDLTVNSTSTLSPGSPTGTDLAMNSTQVATDSNYSSSYTGANAIDGVVSLDSRWVSTNSSSTHWIKLDLGATYDVDGFVIRHAGAAGESTSYNLSDFQIQSGSSYTGPWTDEISVTGSTASVTSYAYDTPAPLRYVRLYITDAGIDDYVRLPEFEVIGDDPNNTMADQTPSGSNVALSYTQVATDSNYSGSYPGDNALDGVISLSSRWVSDGSSPPHWLKLDLGSHQTVDGYIVRHASTAGEATYYNLEAFKIQSSTSYNGPWTDEVDVDNSAQDGVTNRTYATPKNLRYIRLYITDPGIDNYVRLPEFEVIGQ